MVKPATSYKPKGYNNVTLMLTFEDNKCEEALEVYKVCFRQRQQTLHAACVRARSGTRSGMRSVPIRRQHKRHKIAHICSCEAVRMLRERMDSSTRKTCH